jgi:two-component sensor histidine kinase
MPADTSLKEPHSSQGGREHGRGLRLQLLAVLTLSLSPLLFLSVAQGVIEFREEQGDQRERFHSIMVQATADLDAALVRSTGVVTALASYPDVQSLRGPRCVETLHAVQTAQPIYSNLKLVDAGGRVICSAIETEESVEISQRPWFVRLRAGDTEAFSEIYLDWSLQRPVMTAAHALRDEAGFSGAIAADLDVQSALRLLRTQELPPEMSLALSDGDGNLSYVSESEDQNRIARLPEEALQQVRTTGAPVLLEGVEGVPGRSLLVAPLAGRDIQLALISPSLLLGSWAGFDIVGTVLVPSLMWLLALLCVSLAVDFFVLRWLSYLGRMARLYGAGRLGLQPVRASRAPAEIRTLAETLASMANDLEVREAELENVAEQRGALLREIHHRVKNNLQVTMSLLNIQARRSGDSEARRVLEEARGRIHALALVHRTLYENDDLRSVSMRPFLEQLLEYLREASSVFGADVEVSVDAADVELDPDLAIPAALFITEAVTNAYKHAFSERGGRVDVRLVRDTGGKIAVSVCDNGRGFAEGDGDGMGTSLMQALSQRLNGRMDRSANPGGGACVSVSFAV